MTKYEENVNTMSRTKKNSNIYSNLDMNDLSRIRTNNNVRVISEAPKQIDIEKIKRYINSKNEGEFERRKRVVLDLPEEEKTEVLETEPKDYDINTVLERAKESKEASYNSVRYRKINSSEYDILNKIKVVEEEYEKDPDITGPINELNTEEKTIVDLINDISKTKVTKKEDLFSDLMGDNENTVCTDPIVDEKKKTNIGLELENISIDINSIGKPLDDLTRELMIDKAKLDENIRNSPPSIEKIEDEDDNDKMTNIDKSFFTNSLSFSKGDFESKEDEVEEKPKGEFYTKFAIAMIIIFLAATAVVVMNYVLDFNWF